MRFTMYICPVIMLFLAPNVGAEQFDTDRVYSQAIHSRILEEQRESLLIIQKSPGKFLPLLRKSIKEYPRLLVSDHVAADRVAYVLALIGDSLSASELAAYISNNELMSACIYDCAPIFALAVQARFRNWQLPKGLNEKTSTVSDLLSAIRNIDTIQLVEKPIDTVVSGPWLDRQRPLLKGKSVSELIRMAGPNTKSIDERMIAAFRLQTVVTSSTDRLELYLLAMNNIENDASQEYRYSVHQSIFRAEKALVLGR